MALTKGEVVQVLGRTLEDIGQKFDDSDTPDEITKEELMEVIQRTLGDLLAEFAD